MARYRPPMTVCLPFEEWPALHQEAWRQANRDGDILTGRGPAAHWKPKSRFERREGLRQHACGTCATRATCKRS